MAGALPPRLSLLQAAARLPSPRGQVLWIPPKKGIRSSRSPKNQDGDKQVAGLAAVPAAGLAGEAGRRELGKGRGLQQARGLERAFAAGEKGSVVACQEAGEAQSRLCSEGSRRWGAGAAHILAAVMLLQRGGCKWP